MQRSSVWSQTRPMTRPLNSIKYLCCFLLFSAAAFVSAQETQIYYTSGGEFTLTSGGYRTAYQGGSPDSGALVMNKDDIIQTGAGSFIELRLEPGGTRIKIAENTSLICNGPGPETLSMSFSLVYGRIRISTTGIWDQGEGNAVFIRAGQVDTVFRVGDAGVDYLINTTGSQFSQGEPVLTVYNFNGNSEVRPVSWQPNSTTPTVPGFIVYEYQSLTIETSGTFPYIERKALDNEIIRYWNNNNFSDGVPLLALRSEDASGSTPVAAVQNAAEVQSAAAAQSTPEQNTAAVQTPQAPEQAQPVYTYTPPPPTTIIEQIYPDNPFHKKLFRVKNVLISTGMVFIVGGIGMQVIGNYGVVPGMDKGTNSMIYNLGYIPIVLGLIFNGAALVINPQNMAQNESN